MKREDGDALLVRGGYDEVVDQAAALFLARRAACPGLVTASAPTNDDAAAISDAIRRRLQAAGEIGANQVSMPAQTADRARIYNLPLAIGDRLRLYKRTPASIEGSKQGGVIGSNGSIVTVGAITHEGLELVNEGGTQGRVKWSTLQDPETGRLLLGPGWCLTIDSAQGITSAEHLNFLPRGSAGTGGAHKAYVAESRHVTRSITVVAAEAERDAIERRRARGPHPVPITEDEIWHSIGASLSRKARKVSALSVLDAAEHTRLEAARGLCLAEHRLQIANLDGSDPAPAIRQRQADIIAAEVVKTVTPVAVQSAAPVPTRLVADLPARALHVLATCLAAALKRRRVPPAQPTASAGVLHVVGLARALAAEGAAAPKPDAEAIAKAVQSQRYARSVTDLVPVFRVAAAPPISFDLGDLTLAAARTLEFVLRRAAAVRAPLPPASAEVAALGRLATAAHAVAHQQALAPAAAPAAAATIREARSTALVAGLPLLRLKPDPAVQPKIPDIPAGFGDILRGALEANVGRLLQLRALRILRCASNELAELLAEPSDGPWQLSVGRGLLAVGQAYERVQHYHDEVAVVRARDTYIEPLQRRAAALPIAGQARSLEAEFRRIVPGLQPVPITRTPAVTIPQPRNVSQGSAVRSRNRDR